MKNIIIFFICFTFFSCEKEPTSDPGTNASGSVQYKVNGNLVVMDNVDILTGQYVVFAKQLKGSIIPETRYLLNAQKGANNILIMAIVTDSLRLINYHYDSSYLAVGSIFALNYNGQLLGISGGDYFDVNITGYQNSKISGTFTAKLQSGSIIVTEGKLNNVQVIY